MGLPLPSSIHRACLVWKKLSLGAAAQTFVISLVAVAVIVITCTCEGIRLVISPILLSSLVKYSPLVGYYFLKDTF